MIQAFLRTLRQSDWVLSLTLVLLVLISLSALYASGLSSEVAHANFVQQVMFVLIGFALYIFFSVLDYRQYKPYGIIIFIVAALSLIAVLLFGTTVRSTTGWFRFGNFGLQPIEFVKILWILTMAWFLSNRGQRMNELKQLAILGGLMIVLVGLTLLQPDLGSALIVIATTLGVLFMTNVKRTYILWLFVLVVIIFFASWTTILQEYQKERILVLIDPSRDPLGRGYHVTQSIIAIGSGGWLGRGLGFGSQSQLQFLPEQQTDFIFAVIAEELGFIGAGMLLVLFGVLLFRCVKIGWEAHDPYGTFAVFGIMLMVFFHILVNVGMNLGLLPVAGIPLPFVSYGGSSLLAMMIALGVVQSVRIHQAAR